MTRSLVGQGGLPISSVLPADVIEAVFRRHDALFGGTYTIYTTAIVLWAFLCQVLADGKLRSCAAAVARIADFLMTAGRIPPSPDTGAYCVAREKLNENALHELLAEMACKIEHVVPEPWLWRGRHAKLVDAFPPGNVAVFDRYHGSHMTLALLRLHGVDACTRLHQRRPHDMRRGRRLGKYDRLVTWQCPAQPLWMEDATYATIPETITLRMIRCKIVVPGRRTTSITIVTTLLDPHTYPARAIA